MRSTTVRQKIKSNRPRRSYQNRITDLIAAIYPLPNPLESYEDWRRFTHQDLDDMTHTQLNREYELVRCRRLLDDPPHHWFTDRLERVRACTRIGGQNA